MLRWCLLIALGGCASEEARPTPTLDAATQPDVSAPDCRSSYPWECQPPNTYSCDPAWKLVTSARSIPTVPSNCRYMGAVSCSHIGGVTSCIFAACCPPDADAGGDAAADASVDAPTSDASSD